MTSARHANASANPRRRDLREDSRRERIPARGRTTAAGSTTPRHRSRTPRHAGSTTRHRLRSLSVGIVGVLAFTLTLGGTVYAQLQSGVDAIDVDGLIDPPPNRSEGDEDAPPADPNAGTPLNILVIGSDSRADGAVDDSFTSVLADTHIIAHISADRSRVELVSIPRDTMVDIPQCRTTSGTTVYARFGMYNSAFAEAWVAGGDKESAVACDINLAQATTGLTIDGAVLVEMGGFINMVDALGGVDICIPEAINAPKANLVLPAGDQTLDGEQALGYARARVGVGNGSDTGRIERQQRLMSAMVDEVLSRNVLADGPALYQMLNAALGSLTMTSTGPVNLSSLPDMAGLALSLRDLDMADVTFMTTPYATYAPDPNRLVFTSEVDLIWERMAADEPITGALVDDEQPVGDTVTTPTDEATSADDAPTNEPDEAPSTEQATTSAGTTGGTGTTGTADDGVASADELTSVCR